MRQLPSRYLGALKPQEIAFIRQTFSLSQRDLAKALNVSPATVSRWESGSNEPTGLQGEVLRALHSTALDATAKNDAAKQAAIGGLIALGVGAMIFYLLTREQS